MKEPIRIIGAGPSGLTAAIVLAKNGHEVRVCEKHSEVGQRFNCDFQGLENWSSRRDVAEILEDIGLEINFQCVPYYRATLCAPGTAPTEVRSNRPIAYLVRRGAGSGTLDAGLKAQALSAGAEIVFGCSDDENTGKETFGATIVATGPRTGSCALAVGITFETAAEDQAVVVFGDEVAPKGYAYLLINQGHGTMATVLFEQRKRGGECYGRMLEFFQRRVGVEINNDRRWAGYGDFLLRDTRTAGRKLYVGEAAGFQDALWGFGMRYAIVSGYLAARSIIEGRDYDDLWKRELEPMLEMSLVNRYLFAKLGDRGCRYLVRNFTKGEPCDFLFKHYNHSRLKHLLLPLVRKQHETIVDAGQ